MTNKSNEKWIETAMAQGSGDSRSFSDLASESALLGALIRHKGAFDEISSHLKAHYFFDPRNRTVYEELALMVEENEEVDAITLNIRLVKKGADRMVGGLEYINNLIDSAASPKNLHTVLGYMTDAATWRGMQNLAKYVLEQSQNSEGRPEKSLKAISAMLDELEDAHCTKTENNEPTHIAKAAAEFLDYLEEIQNKEDGDEIAGLSTGIWELDQALNGLEAGKVYIFAARPAMGKTALALNICAENGFKQDKHVIIFSLEMVNKELYKRFAVTGAKISNDDIKRKLDNNQLNRLAPVIQASHDSKIYLYDRSGLSVSEMRSILRRHERKHGQIDLVMIDYLQLMEGSENRKFNNRQEEISDISRNMKGMSKLFDCPFLVISQLNRGVEQRPNKRPVMSDLRESGAVEQDSDAIMFIYRDEVYNPDSPDRGTAEVIIGKNRDGRIGTVRTAFRGEFFEFDNMPNPYASNGYAQHDNSSGRQNQNYHWSDDE